ncbi:MerR family transcriptional regulator [Solirubrobacter soli]|uniref:MerR family transcriptional regulator n=1 Tax=Solirubrobacter soli TaxID=363832 RepID=UPI00055F6B5E|nr:MerR family transcriptional regulator [Solirubrobacter soli]
MSITEPSGALTIAEVAARSGLSAHTLRYYERIGLLDPVMRVHGGQRRYDAEDLAWLAFLQRLRATGMAIRDMQRYAELRRQGDGTVAARRALLEEHRDGVLERIAELQRDLAAVTYKITNYEHLEHTLAHRHSHS